MKTKILLVIFFILCFCADFVYAGAPPPHPPTPGCWPPPCIPIDGGISLLIAAGAIYGGKKLYNHKKEKHTL